VPGGHLPRGFVASVVDALDAGAVLAARKLRVRAGTVVLARQYDRRARVVVDGHRVRAVARDPDSWRHDVQHTAKACTSRRPRGLRLVQVDPDVRIDRAERGRRGVRGRRMGRRGARSSGLGHDRGRRRRCRGFATCRPDVWAFDGTEAV
jgi:hypothetical protein